MVTKRQLSRKCSPALVAKVKAYELQLDESLYSNHGSYDFDIGIVEAPLTKEEANLLASEYFFADWAYVYYCHCRSEVEPLRPATRFVLSDYNIADRLIRELGEVVFEYNPSNHDEPKIYSIGRNSSNKNAQLRNKIDKNQQPIYKNKTKVNVIVDDRKNTRSTMGKMIKKIFNKKVVKNDKRKIVVRKEAIAK